MLSWATMPDPFLIVFCLHNCGQGCCVHIVIMVSHLVIGYVPIQSKTQIIGHLWVLRNATQDQVITL